MRLRFSALLLTLESFCAVASPKAQGAKPLGNWKAFPFWKFLSGVPEEGEDFPRAGPFIREGMWGRLTNWFLWEDWKAFLGPVFPILGNFKETGAGKV